MNTNEINTNEKMVTFSRDIQNYTSELELFLPEDQVSSHYDETDTIYSEYKIFSLKNNIVISSPLKPARICLVLNNCLVACIFADSIKETTTPGEYHAKLWPEDSVQLPMYLLSLCQKTIYITFGEIPLSPGSTFAIQLHLHEQTYSSAYDIIAMEEYKECVIFHPDFSKKQAFTIRYGCIGEFKDVQDIYNLQSRIREDKKEGKSY